MHLPSGDCEKDQGRVDANGRAYAGSQRQVQTYVNDSPEALNKAIADSFGRAFPTSAYIRWVSPLKDERYTEYRDGDFLRALGIQEYASELSRFWPGGGPRWDALAHIEFSDGRHGCVLVEAKSHVDEIYGIGCRASGDSLERILRALVRTKEWLGVAPDADWTGKLYQSANRYAHLYFLRVIAGIDAWLVNVYFVNDQHSNSPTTVQEWKPAIREVQQQLGLTTPAPFSGGLLLDALQFEMFPPAGG